MALGHVQAGLTQLYALTRKSGFLRTALGQRVFSASYFLRRRGHSVSRQLRFLSDQMNFTRTAAKAAMRSNSAPCLQRWIFVVP